MGKWIIDKCFEACYSHRVWDQKLCEEFSLIKDRPCLRQHGHNLVLRVYAEAENLVNNMVTDYHHFSWIKKFLDDYIDHRFLLDRCDPLFQRYVPDEVAFKTIYIDGVSAPIGQMINLAGTINGQSFTQLDCEWYSSYFIVPFVPTSENFTRWFYAIANEKMKPLGVRVCRVDWHETPKSRASYEA